MVQAFHAAGIEVWLDVVYNHTAEGDETGPTYSFRGIDNSSYYLLTPDRRHYVNDTGCGNTVRTGHPAARVLVLESLRFWARRWAWTGSASTWRRSFPAPPTARWTSMKPRSCRRSACSRACSTSGSWRRRGTSPAINSAAGSPASAWLQWNGKFRDDVRSFVRGEPGKVGALMQRLYGSDDLFPDDLQRHVSPAPERQLPHRPRRLLPLRPGGLRPKTQRGQRPQQHATAPTTT